MKDKNERILSRRQFAQRAALLSASAPLASAEAVFSTAKSEQTAQAAPATVKLGDAGQAEADSRYQQIMSVYGDRFDDGQKADLRRMCAELQPSLEHIRAYELQNGDAPALYLKPLVEREKKPQAAAAATKKP